MTQVDRTWTLDVTISLAGVEGVPLADFLLEQLVDATIDMTGMGTGHIDVGVGFTTEAQIAALNFQHRKIARATDVLSFPIDGRDELAEGIPRQLGDVVVCPEYVAHQVDAGGTMAMADGRAQDETLEDALARCVVHGMLHLIGYDHETGDSDAQEMFAMEQRVLDAVLNAQERS